jgi:AmmeMemoRadiSam system protein A
MCPSSDDPQAAAAMDAPEYSDSERKLLLDLAHRSIDAALHDQTLDVSPPNDHLAQPRGAFTTLHVDGKLRGCIGYVHSTSALYRTVAETARAAAFDDPRFEPMTAEEAARLKIEISVLSPLRPIRPEDVVVGKHGLIVTLGLHRGLLLPQVPIEWNWDRETFLSQTCLKAGLPPRAWEHGAELQVFTAEVFGEE